MLSDGERRRLARLVDKRPELLSAAELIHLQRLADDLALLVRARDVGRTEARRRNEMGRPL